MKALKRKMRMSVKAPLWKRGWEGGVVERWEGRGRGKKRRGEGKVDEEKRGIREFWENDFGGGEGWLGSRRGDTTVVTERVDRVRLAVGPSIAYRGAKSGTGFILRDLGKLSA
jgi:hypothetical protein